MTRSLKKGPYICSSLLRKINKIESSKAEIYKIPIKTKSRRSTIIPSFFKKKITFQVHNGKGYVDVVINKEDMIGRKLGEFVNTRKHPNFEKLNKNKNSLPAKKSFNKK